MAEIVKFAVKEPFRPTTSVGYLYRIAPAIAITDRDRRRWRWCRSATSRTSSARPSGSTGSTSRSDRCTCSRSPAISFYGIMLGGWASGSKYSFLGAMRGAAQLISYEVSQGLSLVGVVITAQTLSLTGIVHAQAGHVVLHPPVRRLPDLHGRRRSPRPTARRSTSSRPTPSWSAATSPSTAARRSSPTCSPST